MSKQNKVLPKFKQGDLVEWRSHAHGKWRTKIGIVVSIINAGGSLHNNTLWRINNPGMPRDHESYVIALSHPHRPTEFFWPRVSGLKKAKRYMPLVLPKKNMTLNPTAPKK